VTTINLVSSLLTLPSVCAVACQSTITVTSSAGDILTYESDSWATYVKGVLTIDATKISDAEAGQTIDINYSFNTDFCAIA